MAESDVRNEKSLWKACVCQAVLPKMREQGHGLVIVISSVAGKVPIPMQSHYSSSKYALEAMVECVRMEMKRFGVQAVLIKPGDTHTGFTDNRQFYDNTNSPYKEVCAARFEYKLLMFVMRFIPDKLRMKILCKIYLP